MDEFMEMDDNRQVTKQKLRQYFDEKIVRKDLTKHIKEGVILIYRIHPFHPTISIMGLCQSVHRGMQIISGRIT